MTREEVNIDNRDNIKPILGDCISRQAVLDLIADYDLSMGQVVRGIHALPSVTPQEPKTGHWIEDAEQHHVEKTYHCSECGHGVWGNMKKRSIAVDAEQRWLSHRKVREHDKRRTKGTLFKASRNVRKVG